MPRKLISFDWAMKKLLRSKANFAILEGFLTELLKEPIEILELLESEGNKETRTDKFNRVDLKVKNSRDEIILVEIRCDYEFDHLQRLYNTTLKVDTEHIQGTKVHSAVVKVISVNILYFDFGHGSDYIYHGTTVFKGLHDNTPLQLTREQQQLYDKTQDYNFFPESYLIKVNNFDNIAKTTLDEWIYFLKNEEIKEDFSAKGIKQAKAELDIMKLPESECQAYSRYQDDLRYQASLVESSYYSGLIQGERRDIAKRAKQGFEIGGRKKAMEIATNLLDILDVKTIAQKTGLTEAEVQILKNKQPPES